MVQTFLTTRFIAIINTIAFTIASTRSGNTFSIIKAGERRWTASCSIAIVLIFASSTIVASIAKKLFINALPIFAAKLGFYTWFHCRCGRTNFGFSSAGHDAI
jgi:hypothetical protein